MLAFKRTAVRWLCVACLAGIGLARPANALADGLSEEASMEERRAFAKGKYQEGATAYSAGRFKDAVDLFLAADRLAPSAPLSFNIARAYEKLGDDAGTLRWYRDYLRRSPNAANAGEVQAQITALAHALQKKGIQQLTILSSPAGATVTLDDQPLGVTPWTTELAPGQHHLLLSLRGYVDIERDLTLLPDLPFEQTLRLEQRTENATAGNGAQQAPANTPLPGQPVGGGKKLGVAPWVTLGAGGAALGLALTFEILRRSSETKAEKDTVQVDYRDHLSLEQSRQMTARIFAGVGSALLAAGGLMLLFDTGGGRAPVAGSLSCLPNACGFAARGSF
jgi:tetratricopeptide (TPR) repeat protein